MKKMDQINKAKNLLSQALGVALNNLGENSAVSDAKSHMRQALKKLEDVGKSQTRKMQDQETAHDKWWGNVTSGVAKMAESPVAQQAYQKSLNVLDSMISDEEKKLQDLEDKDINNENNKGDSLLTD